MYTIGIDIGGMSIKVGLVDQKGKIINKNSRKTADTAGEVISNIKNQIDELLKVNNITIADINGIGIGCPGSITSATGVVEYSNNLKWNKVPIVAELKKFFDVEIKISNDANVAALGEAIYGCAKDYNSSVMFTLGTGVGGGVVIDRKLFEGGESKGTELGHTTLIYNGLKCSCGRTGCVECYTSATALMRQGREAMELDKNSSMWKECGNDPQKLDGRIIFDCAKKGDETALKVVKTYATYLAESMLNMFNIFRPNAFILGGGVSAAGSFLTDMVVDYCEKENYGYTGTPKVKILLATLGNDAGIIGAAALIGR